VHVVAAILPLLGASSTSAQTGTDGLFEAIAEIKPLGEDVSTLYFEC